MNDPTFDSFTLSFLTPVAFQQVIFRKRLRIPVIGIQKDILDCVSQVVSPYLNRRILTDCVRYVSSHKEIFEFFIFTQKLANPF